MNDFMPHWEANVLFSHLKVRKERCRECGRGGGGEWEAVFKMAPMIPISPTHAFV